MVSTGPKISSHIVTEEGSSVTMTVGSIKYHFDLSDPPPTRIVFLGFLRACSMYPVILSNVLSSITALMKFPKSSTPPIRKLPMSATRRSFTSSQRLEGIYARDAAEHFCPWYSNAPDRKSVV